MAFITNYPLGRKKPRTIRTSNGLVEQLWQELVMLRHVSSSKTIAAPKSTAPWIDQAKIYYLDANKSEWNSAGLLYYYSFLNLAKAFLVAKRVFTYKKLNTTSIYHGLSSDLQSVKLITDYEVTIHPANSGGKSNVYSHLFETLTGEKWPFRSSIKIKMSDIAGYCQDISTELNSLFGIQNQVIQTQSLLRQANGEIWFELVVPSSVSNIIKTQVSSWYASELLQDDMNGLDKNDWITSHNRVATTLANFVILRGEKYTVTPGHENELFKKAADNALSSFFDFSYPTVFEDPRHDSWLFFPKINILGKQLTWHPILSDYLFAFILSSILRYQPQLLHPNSQNIFLAEAWCNQSAVSVIRRFLMSFTKPSLRITTY